MKLDRIILQLGVGSAGYYTFEMEIQTNQRYIIRFWLYSDQHWRSANNMCALELPNLNYEQELN